MIFNTTEAGESEKPGEKLKVGAVSYLNTKPLIYGFEQGLMKDEVELIIDYPSNIAQWLLNNKIDIGLVPVAIIPELKQHFIVSDYCISSDGEVESVCIFSDVPINNIQTVLLDYQSRTSIVLAQFLLKEFWQLNPVFERATENFQQQIKGATAAVVIGDRAFEQRKKSKYCYDLGLAWKQHTGLPFVYAAWISNKKLSKQFTAEFNAANEFGLGRIDEVIEQHQHHQDEINLKEYYTRFIEYKLTNQKLKAMELFLEKCIAYETAPLT